MLTPLTGGTGNDRFDFNAFSELGASSTTRDVITDFSSGDKIDLSTIDANTSLTGDQAFTHVSAFTTAGSQIMYSNGVVYFNTDHDTTAEYQIQLTGAPQLTASDFIL